MTIETSPLDAERSNSRVAVPPGTLQLVLELCERLWAADVRYCHWKSNDMLERSATAENDLDLLVHRCDAQAFAAVMAQLGFRRAIAPGGREHPGVSHHYALDAKSGRFVHIHAHFMLVLGDDTTKNYRLPIETAYLASCTSDHLFPTPAAEFELAVFVIRMMLKHATWDAVAVGKGSLGESESRELAWLLDRADQQRTYQIVADHLPGIGVDLWRKCLQSLLMQGATVRRLPLGRLVLRGLRPHARRSRAFDTTLRVTRRATWGTRRYVLGIRTRKRMDRAGATICVVGGDGSGKSTAVEGLAEWLGGPFQVHRVHLGKPRPSLLTLSVKGPMYVARALGLLPGTAATVDPRTATPDDFPGNAWVVWQLLTARDRLRTYRKLRAAADSGELVVSDRWPLREIRLMDGARTTWLLDHPDRFNRFTLTLARREGAMYAQIGDPDVLVVLSIDPEIAVARRQDEEAGFVRARNAEVRAADWSHRDATLVDAAQPAGDVLATIKRAVWSRM